MGGDRLSPPGFRPLFRSEAGIRYFRRDNGDGTSTYVGRQDITPIVEDNRREFSEEARGRLAARGRWGVKVASVPLIFLNQWAEAHLDPRDPERGQKLREIVRQKLRDPDFRDFRTANIRS
jgi:hypothetical protein